jgi:hypothetical protein
MEKIIKHLRDRFPTLEYKEGTTFYWSPKTNQVFYSKKSDEPTSIWSLLHETSHALLGHTTYKTDFELLRLEVAAWEKAKQLSGELGIVIDESHIQDCLDTYRDWLYARSICPYCNNKSLQQSDLRHYQCFNCHAVWNVTPSRFCRAYRSTKRAKQPTTLLFFEPHSVA